MAQGGILFVDYQHTSPVHLVNVNVGWSREKWEVDGYIHYQSSTQGLFPSPGGNSSMLTPIAHYISADARIGYKPSKGLTLALAGRNFAQATQRQTSGPRIERQVMGTITVDF